MMFYLMENDAEQRMMIDRRMHDGCLVVESTEAQSWIHAKRKFGFPLTPLQEMRISKVKEHDLC